MAMKPQTRSCCVRNSSFTSLIKQKSYEMLKTAKIHIVSVLKRAGLLLAIAGVLSPAMIAEPAPSPPKSLIDGTLLSDVRDFLNHEVVLRSLEAANARRQGITNEEILELDAKWREEAKDGGESSQPLIATALGSPISTFLLRVQAKSAGLFTEIFVMDANGLNVGQSSITSDYWQGDEDKVLKTFPLGAGAVFIDTPEYREDLGIWAAQVNLTIDRDGTPIGSSTVEVNLTELDRRHKLGKLSNAQ